MDGIRKKGAGRPVVLLLLLLVLLLLGGCNEPTEAERVAMGEQVYISHCSHCHQPEGQGYAQVYPPLAGNPIVTLHDPTPAIEIVLHGRGAMPSFYDELTIQERAQVISFIRKAWGNNAGAIGTWQAQ
jgi:mono/diheme cytochrome c family protein